MNPAMMQRAFPMVDTASPSHVSSSSPIFPKSVWPSAIGFPSHFPSMWPQWSGYSPFTYPMFSMADFDKSLFGQYSRRTEDPNRGLAMSALQMGWNAFHFGQAGLMAQNARSRSVTEGSSKKALTDPSDLPSSLTLGQTELYGIIQYGIFAKTEITKGTRYGPYRGKIVQKTEIKINTDNHAAIWEVFDDGKLSHYVDGRTSSGIAGWMSLVQCARSSLEQNMEVIQQDGEIYYQAMRDIPVNSELFVWYSEDYEGYFGKAVGLDGPTSKKSGSVANPDSEMKEEAPSSEGQAGFSCERCGKMFTYKYYLEKHLKFTRCVDKGNRGFPCPTCTRSFEKRDRLRIHILHVHEKYKPHVCAACGKAFSQSSSLNKHIRVHTGQRPYKCVHCAKTFTASSILRTHIRQHSGEKPFKCKFCGKSFASHAAHDSHVRRSHVPRTLSSSLSDEAAISVVRKNQETGAVLLMNDE